MGPSQFLFLDITGLARQEYRQEMPEKVHTYGELNVF